MLTNFEVTHPQTITQGFFLGYKLFSFSGYLETLVSISGEEQSVSAFLHKWSTSWVLLTVYKVRCYKPLLRISPVQRQDFLKRHGLQCKNLECMNLNSDTQDQSVPILSETTGKQAMLHLSRCSTSKAQQSADIVLTGRSMGKNTHNQKFFQVAFEIHALAPPSQQVIILETFFATSYSSVYLRSSEALCYKWHQTSGVQAGGYCMRRHPRTFLIGGRRVPLVFFYNKKNTKNFIFVFEKSVTWQTAHQACGEMNSSLPVVLDLDQLEHLVNYKEINCRSMKNIYVGLVGMVST